MKKLLLILPLTMLFMAAYSQVSIYASDFEAYDAGTGLAKQAGDPWTTWSNAPGGAEDPKVTETQANSGTKSVNVLNNNDLVFHFKDRTTGRYSVEWQMFVDSAKLGYFNLLGNFNGSNSVWNFQAYVKNGKLIVDANGPSAATVDFKHGEWKKLKFIVDVEDDFATLYLDSMEVVSYTWSKGTGGGGTTKKLDGINFYGWNDGGAGSSGYYIDDFKFDSIAAPNAPVNLTANVDGDNIYVFWDTLNSVADKFVLLRNNKVVFNTSGLEYTDMNPWPNTYIYNVRAHEDGLGYSHGSNADTAVIEGGVTRELVLMEEFTGTWCGYCPGAAMGLRDLIDVNKKEAVAIAYHNGDPYVNPSATARENYYSVDAFPTMVVDGNGDGSSRIEGGNATQSMYPSYLPLYEKRYANPGFHTVDLSVVYIGGDDYKVSIDVEETFNAFTPLKLHAVLTESNIPKVWLNQTELDFVCRAMYPDANGTVVDFTANNPQSFTFDVSLKGYEHNNCEFVVFLQDDVTREVTQASRFEFASMVGTKELSGIDISVYPNPASDYFNLLSDGNGRFELFNMEGKMILSEYINSSSHLVDVSGFNAGVYIVKYSGKESTYFKKLIIQ